MKKSQVYNIAKLIATIFVVFAHCSRMYTGLGVVHPVLSSTFLKSLTEYIYSFHMPLFFMISGAVFSLCLDNKKYQHYLSFLSKKCRRLILPYFIFGLFYVTPVMVGFHFTNMNLKDYILNGILLSRDSRHLWFILALFWINMIAIMAKPLYQKKNLSYILIILSALLCLFSNNIIFEFRLQSAAYYQIFFFIGMFFNRYYDKIDSFVPCKPVVTIIIGITLLLQFHWNTFYAKLFYGILGSFMILLLCMTLNNLKIWTHSITQKIMKRSYGIYFFHPMIIYVLYYYLYDKEIAPVILCFVIFLISFATSYFLTGLIRKLKIGFVIGE